MKLTKFAFINYLSIPKNFEKLKYTSATLLFIEERGVIPLKTGLFFISDEEELNQKLEIQTKNIMAVIKEEIVKAIIFLSATGFFLNLSIRSNIIF